MSIGGPAQPVIVSTEAPDGGPAQPVAVVTAPLFTTGGNPIKVIEVTDNRARIGGPAMPIVVATGAAANSPIGGPPIPVYVVSGSLNPTPPPANTVLPVISGGTAATVTTTDGTWTGAPTFTYQWERNGVAIGGATLNTYTIVTADIGTTITVTVTGTNAGGSTAATSAGYTPTYTQKVIALAPIGYWPMAEPSGVVSLDASGNGRDGAYTGVTLGNAGIGDGRTAASFNGTTSFNNIYSASLRAAFSAAAGTIAIWLKYNGTVNDGNVRRIMQLRVDANNRVMLNKIGDGRYGLQYSAGGTASAVNTGLLTAAYTHWALTWDKAADQVKAYINGAQLGTTQTSLGVFAGALSATEMIIMAGNTTPIELVNGVAAHAGLWNVALSGAQILSLATVP